MKKDDWQKFQEEFLHTIEKLCDTKKSNAVLSKLLGLSSSGVYKKIALESKLSLDEIILLANHFQLSLDMFLNHKATPIAFQSDAIRRMPEKPIDYLLNLQKHLSYLTNLSNLSYINLAGEVPIFHYMTFKKLFAFKLYVWSFTSWSIPLSNKFEMENYIADKELIESMERCAHTYYHFSGTEIWNIRMIEITINQLLYFIPMKVFKNKYVVQEILAELEEFVYHLIEICTSGTKRFETSDALNKSNVKIYMNELLHSNEVILVTSDQGDMVFCALDTPNFVRSIEPRMTKHIKSWLEKTIHHSTQISGEGEKDRRIMFGVILSKFEKGKKEIINLLNYIYD